MLVNLQIVLDERGSEEWRKGYCDGLLNAGVNFPKKVGEAGYRGANRRYNFGHGAGTKQRRYLRAAILRAFKESERIEDLKPYAGESRKPKQFSANRRRQLTVEIDYVPSVGKPQKITIHGAPEEERELLSLRRELVKKLNEE